MNYQKPKGTRDITGHELRRIEETNARARSFFRQNGYQEIRTPTFEFAELFTRSIGEATDIVEKEIYSFAIDKRVYVLRPEGTASVLRAVIENKLAIPAKFLYIGAMFRKDKPQKGRYREFLQIGIENIGKADPFYDAETVLMGKEFLNRVGTSDFTIHVNSIGCPECRKGYKEILKIYLMPRFASLCEDCQRRFEKNFLRIFDCKQDACQKIFSPAPMITDHLCTECREHYAAVKSYMKEFGIDYAEDKKLVRGLDYYTRTVFEFKLPGLGAQDTFLAGGRYDLLMKELGGDDVPCIGWAMGVDRTLLALPEDMPAMDKQTALFIAVMGERFTKKLIEIRRMIDSKNFVCHMGNPGASIKNQMKDANRFGAQYVVIYGEDEDKNGYYTVKNMESGEQVQVMKADLEKFVKNVV
ncbi:MAG TPA: histidine--tRNA ligase [bacterium]